MPVTLAKLVCDLIGDRGSVMNIFRFNKQSDPRLLTKSGFVVGLEERTIERF